MGRAVLRSVGLAATAALVLASCGDAGPDGYEQADAVLEAIGQDPAAVAGVPEGCTRTETTDEYGFETEILECPDGVEQPVEDPVDPAQVSLDDVIDQLGDGAVAEGLRSLQAPLADLDAACGVDVVAWRDALRSVADEAEALLGQLDPVPDALDGTETADDLGRVLVDRIVLQTECAHPGVGAAIPQAQLVETGTIDLTSRVATVVQDIEQRLTGSDQRALFYLYSQIQYRWMRTQTEPLDLVVLGTSQAGDATDVPVLEERLGATVGNAFLPGALADVQQHWVPEVERLVDPGAAVWYVGAIDLLMDCGKDPRADEYVRRHERLEAAFAASGWFRTVDPLTRVLGVPGAEDQTRGDVPKRDEQDEDGARDQAEAYGPKLAEPTFCQRRAEVMAGTVAGLADAGREVYVVGIPSNPRLVELVDGGLATVHDAIDRLATEYLDIDGVTTLDLTESLQSPEPWRDLTHMTAAGGRQFSDETAAALLDAGFEP